MIPVARPWLGQAEAQAASEAILSGWVTQGPRVKAFEQSFREAVGAKEGIAVSNCTTALQLALHLMKLRSGDEVICPSMSYIATANAIVHAGGIPVFADIDPISLALDLGSVEKACGPRTRGVLLVHQAGYPAPVELFQKFCKARSLFLIEDAACAIGSEADGKRIGTHSDLVCFSMHPRKIITTGDGGMITTNRSDFAERLRLLRQHGMSVNDLQRHGSKKFLVEEHLEVGFNFRLTDIQAAVGIEQLKRLPTILERRREIGSRYHQAFSKLPHLQVWTDPARGRWNYQSYMVRLLGWSSSKRNQLIQDMMDQGISLRRGIMTSHREPAYREHALRVGLERSEQLSDESVILPLFVPMEDSDVDRVVEAFLKLSR